MQKKSQNLSFDPSALQAVTMKTLKPFITHSTIIFILIALGILIYSLLAVQSIISVKDDETYRQEQTANRIITRFDEETINKIDGLKESSSSASIELPPGRRNTFVN